MQNDINNMLLSELRAMRQEISDVKEDLAYLKGSLGQPRDDKKELAKMSGISTVLAGAVYFVIEMIKNKLG